MLRAILQAVAAREALLAGDHDAALRLCNGFAEGVPGLVLDVYARTLVVHDHGPGDPRVPEQLVPALHARLPWLRAALWKVRDGHSALERNGRTLFGELDTRVREDGVAYAVALAMNRDASFYLDTRGLRAWARATLAGKRVLNTFAYTGSLGVAARAAPARAVVQLEKNRGFLEVARRSYGLNGWPVKDLRAGDFFPVTAELRKRGELFDCVFVDPPLFSQTAKGRVDLEQGTLQLLAKVRPLVGDGGALVAVNNALWLSGRAFLAELQTLCDGGYASIETLIQVPPDVVGLVPAGASALPADPAPFTHPTKIAVLRMSRKDGRRA